MNTLNNNEISLRIIMSKEVKCSEQSHLNKPKLIVLFPTKSMEDELVKKEIKAILRNALREQVHSVTS